MRARSTRGMIWGGELIIETTTRFSLANWPLVKENKVLTDIDGKSKSSR